MSPEVRPSDRAPMQINAVQGFVIFLEKSLD
jgi:hypothetical protein